MPVFKILHIVIKLLMCFATLAFAALAFFDGYFMTSWYPTSIDLRMGGIMMVLSVVLVVFSLLVFKKKNFTAVLLILSVALLTYGAFVYNQGIGHEFDEFITLFAIALIVLYTIGRIIPKRL